jgi:hypothetical protein
MRSDRSQGGLPRPARVLGYDLRCMQRTTGAMAGTRLAILF